MKIRDAGNNPCLITWCYFLLFVSFFIHSYKRVWPSIQRFKYVILFIWWKRTRTLLLSLLLNFVFLSLSLARAIQIYFVVLWHLLSFFSNRMSNAKRLLCLIFGSFCNVSRSRREQRLIYGRKEEKLLRLSCAFFFLHPSLYRYITWEMEEK